MPIIYFMRNGIQLTIAGDKTDDATRREIRRRSVVERVGMNGHRLLVNMGDIVFIEEYPQADYDEQKRKRDEERKRQEEDARSGIVRPDMIIPGRRRPS